MNNITANSSSVIDKSSTKDEIISSAIEITDSLMHENQELKERQTLLLAALFSFVLTTMVL
jgi:hypothetical protein